MFDDFLNEPKAKPKRPRESSFWQQLKKALRDHRPSWSPTRLESRVTHGVPDLLLLDDAGRWHLVELKTTERKKVDISPHQVAFASKHARGSCWIAVKLKNAEGSFLYLYDGAGAMDLRLDGLDTEPVLKLAHPFDWELFFNTLANH